MTNRKKNTVVGLFVILSLLILLFGVYFLKETGPGRKSDVYSVLFDQVSTLQDGDPVKVNGVKMGKTAAGAVWLNEDALTAYAFYQYWRQVGDSDVIRFLHLFTDMPLVEIARYKELQGSEINEAKEIHANYQICY